MTVVGLTDRVNRICTRSMWSFAGLLLVQVQAQGVYPELLADSVVQMVANGNWLRQRRGLGRHALGLCVSGRTEARC
jgi:hypothetical protein